MKPTNWHSESIEACLDRLDTTLDGLSHAQANRRLKTYGKNEIRVGKKRSILNRWISQFHNVLIYILLIAAVITASLQQWVDTSVIIAVVLLNALIGYVQEGKAEQAIEALKKILSLKANVLRDGRRLKIDASELVPGDIVFLTSGDKVPADLRLIKTTSLQIDEAILTGESLPEDKDATPIDENTLLSERQSMSYSGTFVVYGIGIGVVIATGKNTEVGRISGMLKSSLEFSTPLLRQIALFGRWLAMIILSFSLLIFLFGIFIRHYPFEEMFMAAVAIAVAVIPEGLPAIITIALAIGVTRMARRHAIIRRLPSVETLSSVNVICTDKTGTLTKNELTVQNIITSENQYEVTGSGYNDHGKLMQNKKEINLKEHPALLSLLRAGVLCNEAELNKENDTWHLYGNPMDGALLALGFKAKLHNQEVDQYLQIDAIPFDSQHKFMATLHHYKGNSYTFIKGAPEKIISMCAYQLEDHDNKTLDKHYWTSQIDKLAKNGMRVLAIAFRKNNKEQIQLSLDDVDKELTLIGVIGIIDSPREEVRDAVQQCQQAGIRIKMVTGDHRLTAQAIAKQVGILDHQILSGEEIDEMSDEQLTEVVDDIDIYTRTVPEHKIRLIKALQSRNHIVAMTGDGVNDAPALKNADVGIAMGIKGTNVAQEASEIVLADDNFTSIKHAVEEARNVYNNLKKAILFILPNDGGEGFSIFLAILFGYTLPITPAQILWVNMVTAVTLALALAFEPPEKNLMAQGPRDPNEPLLSRFLLWRIGFVSFLFVSCMFGLFIYEIKQGTNIDLARTMVVDVLVFMEAVYLINCRRIHDSVLDKEGIFGSKPILIAIGLVTLLQLSFTYLPFMQYFFKTQSLNLTQWSIILTIVLLVFFIIELEKAILRRFRA